MRAPWQRGSIVRAGPTLRAFGTQVLAEAVKATVTAVAGTIATHAVPALFGVVAKNLVETLLARASQVEGKLDRVLREPLLSGVRLLHQGLVHGRDSED